MGGKESEGLAKTVIEVLLPYKANIHSITSDNGTEFANHELIAKNIPHGKEA